MGQEWNGQISVCPFFMFCFPRRTDPYKPSDDLITEALVVYRSLTLTIECFNLI